jgi:predicted transcriptional regulator of viral defense system
VSIGFRFAHRAHLVTGVQKQYQYGTVFVVPGRHWETLIKVAVENGGYVTPSLVAPMGVPAVELRKMVARGSLISAGHGVYRVPELPPERYDEFILARFWSRQRGVISHDSALQLHDLCDINPTEIHLTVPVAYRISRRGGGFYRLHRSVLTASETTKLDGVVLTTIRRTLADCAATVATYLMRQAIASAADRGAITASDAQNAQKQLSMEATR